MSLELQELRTKAAAAPPLLDEVSRSLRDAVYSVESLGMLVADLQREARDCEFEEIPAAVRAHLDGRLLQRTGYVANRAQDAARKLRDLAIALRSLREDCEELVTLVPVVDASPEAPAA